MKKEGNGVVYYLIYKEKKSELASKYMKILKNSSRINQWKICHNAFIMGECFYIEVKYVSFNFQVGKQF